MQAIEIMEQIKNVDVGDQALSSARDVGEAQARSVAVQGRMGGTARGVSTTPSRNHRMRKALLASEGVIEHQFDDGSRAHALLDDAHQQENAQLAGDHVPREKKGWNA